MKNQLLGIHHVTAMTDDVERNYRFFTEILGMRLVKKSVNQDEIYNYHTYYGDDSGNAGTNMTFFYFPQDKPGIPGTNSIYRVSFRVPSDEAIDYYKERFKKFNVKHEEISEFNGHKILKFYESDGQAYQLISDEHNEGVAPGKPWKNGPVPEKYAIYGLGPVEIRVTYYEFLVQRLRRIYEFDVVWEKESSILLEMGEGGNGAQLYIRHDGSYPTRTPGYGEIHHLSFRVKDDEAIEHWAERYKSMNVINSGVLERFYFKALYTQFDHIIVEISTDVPGFTVDEPYESLGEKLSLPPHLEPYRKSIESKLRPFQTKK